MGSAFDDDPFKNKDPFGGGGVQSDPFNSDDPFKSKALIKIMLAVPLPSDPQTS